MESRPGPLHGVFAGAVECNILSENQFVSVHFYALV